MLRRDGRFGTLTSRGWALLAGFVFSFGGVAAGGPILVSGDLSATLLSRSVSDPLRTIFAIGMVGVGTFASGALLWWAIIERPRATSWLRGVAVGVLTVILANVVSVFLSRVLSAIPGLFRVPGFGTSVEFLVMPVIVLWISAMSSTLWIAAFSLLLFGVVLFPVGITIGLVLVRLRTPTIGGTTAENMESTTK